MASATPRRARSRRELSAAALALGALAAKVIAPSTIATAAWVRWKCQFGCGGYGSSRMCPPFTPTPAETATLLAGYSQAVIFEAPRGKAKSIALALERQLFLAGDHKALGLGAGPCLLCRHCALEEGCRHPEKARPALEACGIDVFATVRRHGFAIEVVRSREDTPHYFGLVLVR
jgi:predicted metal-binding protein